MGERIILHCDLNSFYASVELLDKPALWEVPVAVCGDPKTRHGIILAKNEPAKKYGIQTAETVWQAKKKCPGLVLLPPHHDLYKMWSVRVNDIYERFTDLIEPFGIDESWLDVTGSLHLFGGDAEKLANKIRKTVKNETGLTISVGVSFNKVFAKLGSDMKKTGRYNGHSDRRVAKYRLAAAAGQPVVCRPRRHPDPEKIRYRNHRSAGRLRPRHARAAAGKDGPPAVGIRQRS